MKTKLVYVLTCAPEATYIEQALMAVWSARYHNPDAHIVLMTDNLTSALLHSDAKRGEILRYITEEMVIPFEDTFDMHYRSRWLKSHVRELNKGDLIYIDCDTICAASLAELDKMDALMAMVPDEHLPVREYPKDTVLAPIIEKTLKLGYDVSKEEWYFNGGVAYAKDYPDVRKLWATWHDEWEKGIQKGIKIDQPSLGKANLMCNHIIERLPDVYNTLIYMNPVFAKDGKILHFWNFRNKSFLFAKPFLLYLRENGLTEYAKACILKPMKSVLPFDNILTRSSLWDFFRYAKQIRQQRALYAANVDATFADFPWPKDYSLLRRYIAIKLLGKKKDVDVFFT